MDAIERELIKTTPAGASLIAFARLCDEGIEEFCRNGRISNATMSLMVDARSRLMQDEEAARVFNQAFTRGMQTAAFSYEDIQFRLVGGLPMPFVKYIQAGIGLANGPRTGLITVTDVLNETPIEGEQEILRLFGELDAAQIRLDTAFEKFEKQFCRTAMLAWVDRQNNRIRETKAVPA